MLYLGVGQHGADICTSLATLSLPSHSPGENEEQFLKSTPRFVVVRTANKFNFDKSTYTGTIDRCMYKSKKKDMISIWDAEGTNGNWCTGYSEREALIQETIEAYRKQAEGMDKFEGCMLVSTFGGGETGLTSRILEEINDMHGEGKVYIGASVLDSFENFRAPLDRYNSLIALTWLHRYADVVVHFDATEIMENISTASPLKRKTNTAGDFNNKSGFNYNDITAACAFRLYGLGLSRPLLSDFCMQMCPHKYSKIVHTFQSVSRKTEVFTNWEELLRRIQFVNDRQSSVGNRRLLRKPYAISTMATCIGRANVASGLIITDRGDDFGIQVSNKIKRHFQPTLWNAERFHKFNAYTHTSKAKNTTKTIKDTLSVCINCPEYNCALVDNINKMAKTLLEQNAFVHCLENTLELDDLKDMSKTMVDTIANMSTLIQE